MSNMKKAVDQSGLSREVRKILNERDERFVSSTGIAGDPIQEGLPRYIKTPSEVEYSNKSGASIVLGRDRMGSRFSGYSAKGDTQASSIDLVTGRLSFKARAVDKNNKQAYCDSSAKFDAARIYISAKSDPDRNFSIADGSTGETKTKSCVVAKADVVRLLGRENVKIVTGIDRRNSQGGEINTVGGIDLIANNDDSDLQPLCKGNNLVEALDKTISYMDGVLGILDAFLMSQMKFNESLVQHTHYSPFLAIPTTPSIDVVVPVGIKTSIEHLTRVKKSIVTMKTNLASFKVNYLKNFGERFILSRHNNTN